MQGCFRGGIVRQRATGKPVLSQMADEGYAICLWSGSPPVASNTTRSADLDGVVGEAFVEASQQRDVDRRTDPVLPYVVDQQREEVAMLGVDGIIRIAQACGLVGIARHQHLAVPFGPA